MEYRQRRLVSIRSNLKKKLRDIPVVFFLSNPVNLLIIQTDESSNPSRVNYVKRYV